MTTIRVSLLLYNGLVFLVYGWDKLKAIRSSRRLREATLLWMAAFLGAPGALLGMLLWRHKTRKPRFAISIPLMALAQGLGLWWIHKRGYW